MTMLIVQKLWILSVNYLCYFCTICKITLYYLSLLPSNPPRSKGHQQHSPKAPCPEHPFQFGTKISQAYQHPTQPLVARYSWVVLFSSVPGGSILKPSLQCSSQVFGGCVQSSAISYIIFVLPPFVHLSLSASLLLSQGQTI